MYLFKLVTFYKLEATITIINDQMFGQQRFDGA